MPIAFVPNAGQTDSRVTYLAHAGNTSLYFTPSEAVLSFHHGTRAQALALRFRHPSPDVVPAARGKLPGRVNYLLGSDSRKWQTNLPTYGELVYRGLWPGIDLAFRGGRGKLEYELRLAPRARVADIGLAYAGVARLALTSSGGLAMKTPLGVLTDDRPRSYQLIGEKRVAVASRYLIKPGTHAYGFSVDGPYDQRYPLVIDPGLAYSTFLGGAGDESGSGIAVDPAGNAYVTGYTSSMDFPTTVGAFDTTFNGSRDAFVTKLSPDGSALVYSTFIGGTGSDGGQGISVGRDGDAYVTGTTTSADFPTTAGAFDTTLDGVGDAFVTKLNAAGSALAYSTFLGGAASDTGLAIARDRAGNAYVSGQANSADFPTTAGAFDTTYNGRGDVYLAKLNPAGSALSYATFLGGSFGEFGLAIAVDREGAAYVTGNTDSSDFPTTPGAFDESYNGVGAADTFVTKLSTDGSALAYSTFLGGQKYDEGFGIAVDRAGNAFVAGFTGSTDFPTTPGAFDTSQNGSLDGFVTKLNAAGSALGYSTFLGGAGADVANGIALDRAGNAYVTGAAGSADFPTTPGAFDTTYNGARDAFVTRLKATGSALAYSTFLGGAGQDEGVEIVAARGKIAYVTGFTGSADFPTTAGAFDRTLNGTFDSFVTKLLLSVKS